MRSRDAGRSVSSTDAAAVWASRMGCLRKVDTVHSSLLPGCVMLASKREGKWDSKLSQLGGGMEKTILVFFSLPLAPVPGSAMSVPGTWEGAGWLQAPLQSPGMLLVGLGRRRRGLAMRAPLGKSLQSLTADLRCKKFTSPAENSIFIGDNQM